MTFERTRKLVSGQIGLNWIIKTNLVTHLKGFGQFAGGVFGQNDADLFVQLQHVLIDFLGRIVLVQITVQLLASLLDLFSNQIAQRLRLIWFLFLLVHKPEEFLLELGGLIILLFLVAIFITDAFFVEIRRIAFFDLHFS